MEEIKVGEYIRTENGIIDRCIRDYDGHCGNPNCTQKHISGKFNYYTQNEIVNHNEDISKLIGYGDFINGKMCIDIEHYTRDDGSNGINFVCIGGSVLKENIKSICTREQFENAEYKIGN